jgi:lipoprotein-releasing system ATP-binding protein
MISISGVHKNYDDTRVLKGIDANIHKGDFITIVGASGAGKSTLLHLIAGLDTASEGSISFDGLRLETLDKTALNHLRNQRIGLVFQFHNLLPELTALENTTLPSWIGGKMDASVEQRGRQLLDDLGIAHRANHLPNEMSGGEQQRVAIARALMNAPDILLADEPTGNLDSSNAHAVHALLQELNEKHGQTIVVVTHNNELAKLGSARWQMADGVLIAQ